MFDFRMFLFTLGTAGSCNFFAALKFLMALIFLIAINSLTALVLWELGYSHRESIITDLQHM